MNDWIHIDIHKTHSTCPTPLRWTKILKKTIVNAKFQKTKKTIKAKQYFKEMADTAKAKRNASNNLQQQQQVQQQQLQQQQQQQSGERYNLLSSSIDERPPVTPLVPKPLSVDWYLFFVVFFISSHEHLH